MDFPLPFEETVWEIVGFSVIFIYPEHFSYLALSLKSRELCACSPLFCFIHPATSL